eukprot:m.355431 g.355431  ORF g.355431 m.355431 type:complete len:249 (+) comp17252_c0_seq1:132-878(+)
MQRHGRGHGQGQHGGRYSYSPGGRPQQQRGYSHAQQPPPPPHSYQHGSAPPPPHPQPPPPRPHHFPQHQQQHSGYPHTPPAHGRSVAEPTRTGSGDSTRGSRWGPSPSEGGARIGYTPPQNQPRAYDPGHRQPMFHPSHSNQPQQRSTAHSPHTQQHPMRFPSTGSGPSTPHRSSHDSQHSPLVKSPTATASPLQAQPAFPAPSAEVVSFRKSTAYAISSLEALPTTLNDKFFAMKARAFAVPLTHQS